MQHQAELRRWLLGWLNAALGLLGAPFLGPSGCCFPLPHAHVASGRRRRVGGRVMPFALDIRGGTEFLANSLHQQLLSRAQVLIQLRRPHIEDRLVSVLDPPEELKRYCADHQRPDDHLERSAALLHGGPGLATRVSVASPDNGWQVDSPAHDERCHLRGRLHHGRPAAPYRWLDSRGGQRRGARTRLLRPAFLGGLRSLAVIGLVPCTQRAQQRLPVALEGVCWLPCAGGLRVASPLDVVLFAFSSLAPCQERLDLVALLILCYHPNLLTALGPRGIDRLSS